MAAKTINVMAGEVTIKNTATTGAKTVSMYVPNKDSVPFALNAGDTLVVTTTSAGETFHYLNQATDTLTVEVAEPSEPVKPTGNN